MRRFLLALSLVVAIAPQAEAERTITAKEIEAAGITRLGDILALVDGWAGNTRDGYNWRLSPNGLSPFQTQRWVVMVDGQVLDVGAFETINLNLVPVGIDQINKITFTTEPGVAFGEYTGHGVIYVTTKTPVRRTPWEASFRVMGGNPTGDSGPYRYTDLRTDNVDAIGPDLAASLAYRGSRWSFESNSSILVHYFTDPAFRRANTNILGLNDPDRVEPDAGLGDILFDVSSPSTRRVSSMLRLQYSGSGSNHGAQLAYSNARRQMVDSGTFGRHVPTDHRLVNARLFGEIGVRELCYDAQYTLTQLSRHPGAHFNYDWKTHRVRSRIEWAPGRGRVGAGLDHLWADTDSPLRDDTVLLVPLHGSIPFGVRRGLSAELGAMLTFSNEDKADKFFATAEHQINKEHSVRYAVSLAERLPDEDESLWFWTDRGYALLDSNGVDYNITGDPRSDRQTTADVTWTARHSRRFTTTLSVNYRHFEDLTIERRDFSFDPASCVVSGPVEAVTGQDGHVAGGWLRVDADIAAGLEATLRYHYQRAFDADEAFEDAWRAVPEHRASLQLTGAGQSGLTAWVGLTWQSATDWTDYESADGAVCRSSRSEVTYRSHVDDFFTVDAKVGKSLWARRASLEIIARNILDESVRYHPAGATFGLSFFAQIRVRVP